MVAASTVEHVAELKRLKEKKDLSNEILCIVLV